MFFVIGLKLNTVRNKNETFDDLCGFFVILSKSCREILNYGLHDI